ncbi:hypothetical protein BCR33DRAFT_711809 [Rhizoclosmatium globosum]|uniref:Uncharacterized protein n=1 Tax=Rhizoclosmatium globosum TaxID=329046 RepID=A0A1Y2D056_9FUNG|nr:hypothetical protein BCR33DRAFT_711809 [Rhizoclosmatium globosum]|eukprot:ORY52516.1 hypothetical protein BCR33DRAFT_711809 [Rhizoclosmatium globosum]
MQSPESQERFYKNYDTTLENASAALAEWIISQEDCEHIRAHMNPLHRMLMQNYRLGHMQPIWDLRQTPSVDLITSFDGLSVMLPEQRKPYTAVDTFKLHLDQGKGSHGLESYQGFITLYPVTKNDATLNNRSQRLCPAFGHTPTIPRMVVYICMTPRAKAYPAMMQKRIRVFEELRLTNHLPHRVKLFGEEPRFRARPTSDFNLVGPPVLSWLGRRLVGYDDPKVEVEDVEDVEEELAKKTKWVRIDDFWNN